MTPQQVNSYCINVIGVEHCTLMQSNDDPYPRYYPPDYELQVPCGKCAGCLKSKRLGWSIRLLYELENYRESTFVTLTLDDDNLKRFSKTPKKPLMLYIDRLRKHLGYRPKYFFVSELGEETHRLHYHGIIFGTNKKDFPFELQQDKWQYGICWFGYCNAKTCNYIVKYLLKGSNGYKPFILCSNGIGSSYLDKPYRLEWHVNNFDFREYINKSGVLYPLPTYYKNKIYTEDIKLVKMLNKSIFDPFEQKFLGVTYTDLLTYKKAVRRHFEWTLSQHLSEKVVYKSYTSGIVAGIDNDFKVLSIDFETSTRNLILRLKEYNLLWDNSFFLRLISLSQNALSETYQSLLSEVLTPELSTPF